MHTTKVRYIILVYSVQRIIKKAAFKTKRKRQKKRHVNSIISEWSPYPICVPFSIKTLLPKITEHKHPLLEYHPNSLFSTCVFIWTLWNQHCVSFPKETIHKCSYTLNSFCKNWQFGIYFRLSFLFMEASMLTDTSPWNAQIHTNRMTSAVTTAHTHTNLMKYSILETQFFLCINFIPHIIPYQPLSILHHLKCNCTK